MAKKTKLALDPETAVERGKERLAKLFPEFSGTDVRLEEIETPLSARVWRLTFSASLPNPGEASAENALAELLRPRRLRRTIELDPDNGQLVSIKAA